MPEATAHAREFAAAKINLALHVTARRGDGFHELDTLVVFADTGDWVSVEICAPGESGSEITLTVSGPNAGGLGAASENLLYKAAAALREYLIAQGHTPPPVHLRLEKHLPVASGLGGGSADAAAGLRTLRRLWQPVCGRIDDARLYEIAATLGSDVPMCLMQRPARATGRGEVLSPLEGGGALHLVLANAGAAVSTAEVFSRLNPPFSGAMALPDEGSFPPLETVRTLHNDLQPAAIALEPTIAETLDLLKALPGCKLARMSGSGATCFGLFSSSAEADEAGRQLTQARPNWWVKPCTAGTPAATNKEERGQHE